MILHAEFLVAIDAGKPRQTNLRRAVSTACYTLFHSLTHAGSRFLVAGSRSELRQVLARAFDHADMRRICPRVTSGQDPVQATNGLSAHPPPELRFLSQVFADLQQARHEADYKAPRNFLRSEASTLIAQAKAAYQRWKRVRGDPDTEAFLVALLAERQMRA